MNYTKIREWREQYIHQQENHEKLNQFHDELMMKTITTAMEKVKQEQGDIPAPFAFFLMGSAARKEQSIWSDQDHGIVFDGTNKHQAYFQALGSEIVKGLEMVGYERCDGFVMASKSLWTKPVEEWKEQVISWLKEESWQSLRHFSTFFDSRVFLGEETLLQEVKEVTFSYIQEQPMIMNRLIDNFAFIHKSIGLFGQLLPQQNGKRAGQINIKTTTLFPYVNSLRLLVLWNQISEASTASRFTALKETYPFLTEYEVLFEKLQAFKFVFTKDAIEYDGVHYIPLKNLSKEDKQELKEYMKKGAELFERTKKLIEKECAKWS
ncbi:DUF294 nucleotidyltransferase-like domain-containing protein [Gracilibacillus sp. S3-1-1]|uniref:DUF294 nucleotidyltransferase-like domain-containing protein n=1 Tax=Gracilibacillus pellucidus TaxID=3095368 RepID=A0ACC6M681_9BACI|nr:DUF294 nucleotidyltransferase-like domain-containing protein [Gracilibacillus sp. S3-1-1]MDX8046396.1 DUF294 nucleotidyltransferase-like domain-containing protein [Gracilibacillus sp. S3-1-1]